MKTSLKCLLFIFPFCFVVLLLPTYSQVMGGMQSGFHDTKQLPQQEVYTPEQSKAYYKETEDPFMTIEGIEKQP